MLLFFESSQPQNILIFFLVSMKHFHQLAAKIIPDVYNSL